MAEISIIGGGASGLMAALACALKLRRVDLEDGSHRAHRIKVLESTDKVGRPILRSGNGRCNLSNEDMDVALYHNAEFASRVLSHAKDSSPFANLTDNVVADAFSNLGLLLRSEPDGRLYPASNKASSVLEVLLRTCDALGVEIAVEQRVKRIDCARPQSRITLEMQDGSFARCDCAIVACGGSVARTLIEGVEFLDPVCMLGPVRARGLDFKSLNNIRCKCTLGLLRGEEEVFCESGELLFRDYGLSGIVVFNLSREALPGDTIRIDLLPAIDDQDAEAFASGRLALLEGLGAFDVTAASFMAGLVLPDVARCAMDYMGTRADEEVDDALAAKIVRALKDMRVECDGIADRSICQVRRGGFDVREVDERTLCLAKAPSVLLAGEALDVDGPCGGYNLHWAFASGMLAGVSAANRSSGI